MYDIGIPFLRSWLYGLGGLVVVVAAFAFGFVSAGRGRAERAKAEPPATVASTISADRPAVVVRPAVEPRRFPAFAPEGVIVVTPAAERRPAAFANVESQQHARARERPLARARVRPPVVAARADTTPRDGDEVREGAPVQPSAEEPRGEVAAARDETAVVEQQAPAPAYAEERDDRSWYGSPEYRRELEERRRAERDARRRRD